jgi:hypothetical protein
VPQPIEIAITGSGSLATEVMYALARASKDPISVALLGRDMDRLTELARSAASLASVETELQIGPIVIDWSDDALIKQTIAELRPKVLVHTASLQSPWTLNRNDQWSDLVKTAGFGFTLPLQAVLALKVARAIADESPDTFLINGCYPDAVNRILFANRLKVSGGIGNVAILAALLWSGLPVTTKQGRRLRLIAHHAHLAAVVEGRETRLEAWLDEQPIHDIAKDWFRNARLQPNLNNIAGEAAVPLLFALLGRSPSWLGHSPGPMGLPGGYPVIAGAGGVELDLPAEITVDEAKAKNMTAGLADGILIRDNEVVLPESSRQALKRFLSDSVDDFMTWQASEVEAIAANLVALRESLSSKISTASG